MFRLLGAFAFLSALLLAAQGTADAGELAAAKGLVVLTLAGKLENTNRPPFDDFEDAFFKYHEKTFDKAAEFDIALLESLGTTEIEVSYDAWPKAYRFEGPRLKDVLAAVGATASTVRVHALDGYAVELSKEQLDGEDWIIALKRDGEYLKLGQRGPVWMTHDPGADKKITKDEESKWVWTVFYIEVE